MHTILLSRRFKRSFKKLQKSGTLTKAVAYDFKCIVAALRGGKRIPAIYKDHGLTGHFFGCRECHIKGDLLLVYRRHDIGPLIELVDIGTHSQIFG